MAPGHPWPLGHRCGSFRWIAEAESGRAAFFCNSMSSVPGPWHIEFEAEAGLVSGECWGVLSFLSNDDEDEDDDDEEDDDDDDDEGDFGMGR